MTKQIYYMFLFFTKDNLTDEIKISRIIENNCKQLKYFSYLVSKVRSIC